jgi:hypothetical protein
MKFSDLLEALGDWKLHYDGYSIKINDDMKHDLITRLKSRTEETLESINNKVQQAIDLIMVHYNFLKIKKTTTYCVHYTKSKFKLVIKVYNNKIIFKTILTDKMHHVADITRELNETLKYEYIELEL